MEVEQPIITATHGRAGVATGAAERLRTAAALNGRQDISDVDPGVLNFVISQSKNAGNAAFKRKNYQGRFR